MFHCPPSQARRENADDVLEIMRLRHFAQAWQTIRHDDEADNDKLAQMGISPAMIDLVFSIIAEVE